MSESDDELVWPENPIRELGITVPRAELEALRADKQRLDWLERETGSGLLSDDNGHWIFSTLAPGSWPIRAAIDAARASEEAK